MLEFASFLYQIKVPRLE